MKKIEVHNRCSDYDSYRAARVKSLFNAESGCNFDLEAELPADETTWRIGVIVGPSGSGKSSIGRQFWPDVAIADLSAGWPTDRPIVDAIAPMGTLTRSPRRFRRSVWVTCPPGCGRSRCSVSGKSSGPESPV